MENLAELVVDKGECGFAGLGFSVFMGLNSGPWYFSFRNEGVNVTTGLLMAVKVVLELWKRCVLVGLPDTESVATPPFRFPVPLRDAGGLMISLMSSSEFSGSFIKPAGIGFGFAAHFYQHISGDISITKEV